LRAGTYLFTQLLVFLRELVKVATYFRLLLFFLNSAFESTLSVLKKTSLFLGQTTLLDLFIDLIELSHRTLKIIVIPIEVTAVTIFSIVRIVGECGNRWE
jgi:hypothetical protein